MIVVFCKLHLFNIPVAILINTLIVVSVNIGMHENIFTSIQSDTSTKSSCLKNHAGVLYGDRDLNLGIISSFFVRVVW